MIFLSSNHYSHDIQVDMVINYLADSGKQGRDVFDELAREFPEYHSLKWSGSWVDTEASGVDIEYMSWVTDWLESHTDVRWRDGEPAIDEEGDEEDDT